MSEITKDDVVKFIEGMTVLELSALVKELEEKFGVSAAAPMMAAVAAGGAAPAAAAEEQTEFNAILTGFGAEKPKTIKESVSKDEAADIKKKIEAVGGTVEIK